MKSSVKQLAALALLTGGALAAFAQAPDSTKTSTQKTEEITSTKVVNGVRNIKLNEDRDQKFMVTKIYQLKYINCDDITPWIQGAVQRYRSASNCQALNYTEGKKQYIVVTTGPDMMPYVDEMVATMDRPCKKSDADKSIVDGTGIYKYVYRPKFRGNDEMISTVLADTRVNGFGWYDTASNMFYWKDSKSGGDCVLQWMQAIDRPVPQASVSLNVYEVNDNDFKELGLDWLAWKNGPGASLFGTGYDFAKWSTMADKATDTMSSLGGFMFAPQFDTTYLRLLAEKGKARTASSASLTLVSDYVNDPGEGNYAGAKYKLNFQPNFQYIAMDENRNLSVESSPDTNISIYFKKPTICFGSAGDKANVIRFGWEMTVSQGVEQANATGANMANNAQRFYSYTTAAAGAEKLLASYVKEAKVTQNTGMPYLADIPVLKYLTGNTSASIQHSRVFVTLKTEPVLPKSNLSDWAGKVIEAAQISAVEK